MSYNSSQPLYEEISVIGNGAYGTVYRGYDVKTNRIVAMKRIRVQITEEGLPISTIREIAYLRQLEKYDHENIVKLLDVINGPRLATEQCVILIFEFVDYDLNNYLRTFNSNLSLDKIMDLMSQMLVAVDFLHSNRIIHRDLKPQNILVTKEGKIKIADFGLARIYTMSMVLTSIVVTLWYRSPEVLLNSKYASSVDIWSLGCIFAELYLRRPFFIGQGDLDQLYKIFDILGLPNDEDWPINAAVPLKSFIGDRKFAQNKDIDTCLRQLIPNMDVLAIDLLKKLLDFNIDKRITARNALQHEYFTQMESVKWEISSSENQENTNQPAYASKLDDSSSRAQSIETNSDNKLKSMPDITNVFQPNILKRKRNQGNKQ